MRSRNNPQGDDQDANDGTDDHQDRADHSADFPGLSGAASAGIHEAGVHFLEVGRPHHPCRDAKEDANDQPKNAKNEDQSATMGFHRYFELKTASFNGLPAMKKHHSRPSN